MGGHFFKISPGTLEPTMVGPPTSLNIWHLHFSNVSTALARKADFESVAFRTFDFEKILNNDSHDPDENFFNAFNFKDSQYFTPEESSRNLNKFGKSSFSLLHPNIRNLQKTLIAFSIC